MPDTLHTDRLAENGFHYWLAIESRTKSLNLNPVNLVKNGAQIGLRIGYSVNISI